MAAAELTGTGARTLPGGLSRAWAQAYSAIWAATLGAAALVAAIGPLNQPVQRLLGLRLDANGTPPPHPAHVVALAAHNFPIAAWPLLIGVLGAHRKPVGRHVADAVLIACLSINVLPVGAALGAYGPALLPYVPQLPLEWAGLALGASAWLMQRRRALAASQGVAVAALIGIVLICAAAVETLAVPPQPPRRTLAVASRTNSRGGLRRGPVDIPVATTDKELKDEASGHGRPTPTQ